MYHHLILKLSLIFLITTIAAPAQAERIALVIGNGEYKNTPLDNPTNDADDMKKILSQLGFEVILAKNANRRTMITAIQKFGTRLHHADVGLFFYAGHGLQVKDRNYLVPVDANIKSEADIEHETVDAARVLAQMERANNGINIVILDACRNNPYKKRGFRDLTRGLTRMDGPTGTFIAYATAAGEVADDGKGRNSPFTKNLLWALETIPHLMVGELFKKVAQKMIEEQVSGEKSQIPWRHSSIIGDFCFAACPGTEVSQQLRECKKHFQANRLTTGKGGTAFVCYRDVLTKDPNNVEAKAGLKEIEDRYVAWINRALKRGQRYKAKRYFPRLCKVNPKSPNLTEIKAQLGTSCPQLTRTAVVSRSVETGKGTFHDLLKDGTEGPKMFWIPADESIKRFAIGRYEVTFAEYDKFAEATEKPDDQDWGRGNRPVINVSWEDAMAYAEWLSEETGQKYSLPTEAQWQYAAGTTSQEDICRYGNVRDCSDDYDYTAPVGKFKPNKFGLFDMSGNVSEWTCSDENNSKACVGEKPNNPVIILGDSWYRRQNRMAYTNLAMIILDFG